VQCRISDGKRQRAEYEKEYDSQEFEYGIVDIKSANEWDEHTIKALKINVVDVDEMFYELVSDDILAMICGLKILILTI
jgi:disulfide oxidoreductase YuzD